MTHIFTLPLEAGLLHSADNLRCLHGEKSVHVTEDRSLRNAYNGAHVRLRAVELREHILVQELLHVALDIGVAHDKCAEGGGHIERAKTLGGIRFPVTGLILPEREDVTGR